MKYGNNWFVHIFLLSVCLFCVSAGGESNQGITAITIPCSDVTMSFVKAGIIEKVFVKEGDEVSDQQMLVQQDIEAAQASLAQKKIDLERLEWAAGRGSATELEVEHARLDVKVLEIMVDNMTLKSPIAGTVEKVEVEVGEAVNGLEDVIRVVKTDPLWIDVPVPLEQGRTFTKGQLTVVAFPGAGKKTRGTIIYVSTVADAASSTLRVRIEVPNKEKRPAGEHVQVSFPKEAKSSDK